MFEHAKKAMIFTNFYFFIKWTEMRSVKKQDLSVDADVLFLLQKVFYHTSPF